MELQVLVGPRGLPARAELERWLAAQGVQLVIDALEWPGQAGFLPMKLNSREAGVEMYLDSASEYADVFRELGIKDAEHVVSFRWSSDTRELASALLCAAALARLSEGVIYDAHEGAGTAIDQALAEGRAVAAELK
jgi:hypothetical protein